MLLIAGIAATVFSIAGSATGTTDLEST